MNNLCQLSRSGCTYYYAKHCTVFGEVPSQVLSTSKSETRDPLKKFAAFLAMADECYSSGTKVVGNREASREDAM